MITESFDLKSAEIVKARDVITENDKILARAFPLDTVILTFSGKLIDALWEKGLTALFPLRNCIVFGSCGALTDLPDGHIILPTHAYRDEGTSYHYAVAEDYI